MKSGSLLLLAVGVAGAAVIHRATHGVWFPRPAAADWPAHADARRGAWVSWNRIPIGAPIKGFSGERPDDVWAWSASGIMHWDGRTWTRVPGPGRDAGDVEGVSEWFGTLWVRTAVHIPARSRGWIVSERSETHDWCRDGGIWKKDLDCDIRRPEKTPAPAPAAPPPEIAYLGPTELAPLWSATHAAGGTPPPVPLTRGYRVGGGELWAVDDAGRWLAHFDGKTWTSAANFERALTGPIWFASDDDGWAVGGTALYHWDGRDWIAVAKAPERLRSIWGAAGDDVWAVGEHGLVMHFDGHTWRQERLPGRPELTSVRGSARDDVWVAACDPTGFTAHWDGARWTSRSIYPSDGALRSTTTCLLVATGSDRRVLVANSELMFELRAGGWSKAAAPLAKRDDGQVAGGLLEGLAAADDGDGAWAVGRQHGREVSYGSVVVQTVSPFILRRTASVWTTWNDVPVGTGGANAVWARAANDVWVVGDGGLILRFDGRAWTREASGTDEDLIGIHGAGDTIWIVGAEGGLLRRRL